MNRLSRWSQRKRGETLDTNPSTTTDPASSISPITDDLNSETPALEKNAFEHGPLEERPLTHPSDAVPPDADDCLDDTLPEPESLEAGSDFTVYLQQGVSQGLRRRALRRLFATGGYNVRDGLDDYDQDFRQQKPLSAEIAARLRQWTHKLEEETSDQPESAPSSEDQPVVENKTVESKTVESKTVESKTQRDEHDATPEQARELAEATVNHDQKDE